MTIRKLTIFALAIGWALLFGCDSGSEEEAATPETSAATSGTQEEAPEQEEQETVSGPPVLEATDLPNLGTIQMPRGYSTTAETDHSAHYAYDLGDFRSIQVSWESGEGAGAADLAAAQRSAGWLAGGEVQEAQTLENGMHEVVTLRESDGRSFVLVLSENRYVKCFGPTEYLELLRTICQSAPPD